MKIEEILARLETIDLTKREERVVPVNGEKVPLPYFVIRYDETDEGADMGRVGVTTVRWQVHLFSKQKDFASECKIRKVLRGIAAKVDVERYPDGQPYQTAFIFTTKQIRERTDQ